MTEYLSFNNDQDSEIRVVKIKLKRVDKIKYLSSVVNGDRNLDEIAFTVQAGCVNWRKMSGMLRNHRIKVKVKGKVYKIVVRPAVMYAGETWPMRKAQEERLIQQKLICVG